MITSLFAYFAASVEDKIQTVVGSDTSSSDSGCLFSSVLNSARPAWMCMSPVALCVLEHVQFTMKFHLKIGKSLNARAFLPYGL